MNASMSSNFKEDLGVLCVSTASPVGEATYSFPNDENNILLANERANCLPKGFEVPVLTVAGHGDNNANGTSGQEIDYLLQLTQQNQIGGSYGGDASFYGLGPSILQKSYVYTQGTAHYASLGIVIRTWYNIQGSQQFIQDAISSAYAFFYAGGWDWPKPSAFNNILYTGGQIQSIPQQMLRNDIRRNTTLVMWNLLNQAVDPNVGITGVSLNEFLDYGNVGGNKLTLGSTYLTDCDFDDPFYRYIGAHKIETLYDATSNTNHLSI
jgi:hypothetical protein